MKASIHISTDMVKVLAYTGAGNRVEVKDYLYHPLPEECVLNGVILDGAPVIEALVTLRNAKPDLFKEVSLIIDGSFVYTKRVTIPGKINKLVTDGVIRDEFAEISSDSENLICDHHVLKINEDGSKDILACAVENAHAQAYLAIFHAAGITLTSVHLGILTVLQFVEGNAELRKTPFVLNIVDDVVLLSMIFQNGVNVFQSRIRLYGESRESIVRSTLDGLSGIIQFNRSQNFAELSNCLYLGLSDADMSLIALNASYPDIRFNALNIFRGVKGAERLPPEAHFNYLNTQVPDTTSDLLANIKMLEKAKLRNRPKNYFLLIGAAVGAVLIVTLGVLLILNTMVQRDVRQLKAYMEHPNSVESRQIIDNLKSDTTRYINLHEAVVFQKSETESKPHLSSRLLDLLTRTAGSAVKFNGINFSSDNGTISLSCSSPTEFDAAIFVEALNRETMIETAYYTGYNTTGAGEFVFSIDVIARGWREEADS